MRFRVAVMFAAACLLAPALAEAQDQQPPAEFTKVVGAAKELWYHTNTRLAPQGWVARRPCLEGKVDCPRYFVCRNLKASFMTSLVPDEDAWKAVKRGKRHHNSIVWLWSWTYETPADARLALESLDHLNAIGVYGSPYHNSHRLLSFEGNRVLVMNGHDMDYTALDLTAGRIRSLLGTEKSREQQQEIHDARHGRWRGVSARSGAGEPGPGRLLALQDADSSDEETAALVERLLRAGAYPGDVAAKLNTRGMRLYKKGEFAKAATAFEWASDMDDKNFKAAFNRAALTARGGDALAAAYWIWRTRFTHVIYYNPGSEETEQMAEKARTDPDFDPIRSHPDFVAFDQCLPPKADGPHAYNSLEL